MAEALPVSGSIDPKTFPFLLTDLHRQGATGSFKIEGPSYQKALYFRVGRILFGSSNDPRDQLGAILIEDGKITPEQLEDVNAKVGPGKPLAKVLAETGFVSQRELSEAARAKVERILSDLMAHTSGSFEFEDGVLPKGAIDLKLSTERLVLSAVRRIADRNFVLRHLDSLEVVLAPDPALAERLPELQPEAGGLPEQLDGTKTLKEAASHTRLDEFEAAKIACALLFLGLVQRAAAIPAAEEAPVFTPADGDEGELDLGGVATFALAAAETPSPAPPLAEPEPSPPVAPPAAPSPPKPAAAPPPPAPVRREPEPPRPEPTPVPRAVAPPSKADLAALDALLNPRTVEGPLEPLEKESPAVEPWSPQFGGGRGGRRRPQRSVLGRVLGATAAIALIVGAVLGWYYFSSPLKPVTPQASTRAADAAQPSVTRPAPASVPAGGPASTLAPPASPPAGAPGGTTDRPAPQSPATAAKAAPATAVPSPKTAPSPQAPPKGAPASDPLADARALLAKGKLSEAAQGFQAGVKGARRGTASIQLLVACSAETVQKAIENVRAQELFILPVNLKGRDCFRLCWGIYESEGRAASAVRSVPEYFRKGGATPRVVLTSEIPR